MNEDEWREELRKLYDETYAKKHPKDDDPPDTGGVREPRRPRPKRPSGPAAMALPSERRAQRQADVQELGSDPQFLERVSQAMEFFGVKGVD